MNKNIEIIKIENNKVVEIKNEKLCPLYFFRINSFTNWLKSRNADFSRKNIKLLRK